MKIIRISSYKARLLENEREFDEANPQTEADGVGVYPKGVPKELQKCVVCGAHTTRWFVDSTKGVAWFMCAKCDVSGEKEETEL